MNVRHAVVQGYMTLPSWFIIITKVLLRFNINCNMGYKMNFPDGEILKSLKQ